MKENTMKIINVVLAGYKSNSGTVPKKLEQDLRFTVLFGMDHALPREIKDMLAFIDWSKANAQSPGFIAANLLHDLNGIIQHDPCFCPRTSGYSDLVKEPA